MKRGTTPTLKIQLVGLDIEEAIKIEFLFKQTLDEDCQQKVKKIFIANDEDSPVQYENQVFYVPFDEEETRIFKSGCVFYMDTRIFLGGGQVTSTNIVPLKMLPTLFSEED